MDDDTNTSLPPHLPFTLKSYNPIGCFIVIRLMNIGNGLYKVSLQILINKAYEIEVIER